MERFSQSVRPLGTFSFQFASCFLPLSGIMFSPVLPHIYCIRTLPIAPTQSPPRTHSPGFPKRKCDQKQLIALKFRKINPSWAYLLALLSTSSLVYTVRKVLVHPFGSSPFRKVMHLGEKDCTWSSGGIHLKGFSDVWLWGMLFFFHIWSLFLCNSPRKQHFPKLDKEKPQGNETWTWWKALSPKSKRNFLSFLQAPGLWVAFITLAFRVLLWKQKSRWWISWNSSELSEDKLALKTPEKTRGGLTGVFLEWDSVILIMTNKKHLCP